MNSNKGLFIVVEGIDGSGKTTQINNINEYLQSKDIKTVVTREPGGTQIGEKIRDIILDKENRNMDPMAEMLLYAASRAQHVSELIEKKLESGITVICDRYVLSSYVYQGIARGLDIKTVKKVNEFAMKGITPDITFFINIDNQESIKRRIKRNSSDRIENEDREFHIKVCNGYREMIRQIDNVAVINGMQSMEKVMEEMIIHIDNILRRVCA